MHICLFGTKSLHNPMPFYCQWHSLEQMLVNCQYIKLSITMRFNMSSARHWPFYSGTNVLITVVVIVALHNLFFTFVYCLRRFKKCIYLVVTFYGTFVFPVTQLWKPISAPWFCGQDAIVLSSGCLPWMGLLSQGHGVIFCWHRCISEKCIL